MRFSALKLILAAMVAVFALQWAPVAQTSVPDRTTATAETAAHQNIGILPVVSNRSNSSTFKHLRGEPEVSFRGVPWLNLSQ